MPLQFTQLSEQKMIEISFIVLVKIHIDLIVFDVPISQY